MTPQLHSDEPGRAFSAAISRTVLPLPAPGPIACLDRALASGTLDPAVSKEEAFRLAVEANFWRPPQSPWGNRNKRRIEALGNGAGMPAFGPPVRFKPLPADVEAEMPPKCHVVRPNIHD